MQQYSIITVKILKFRGNYKNFMNNISMMQSLAKATNPEVRSSNLTESIGIFSLFL